MKFKDIYKKPAGIVFLICLLTAFSSMGYSLFRDKYVQVVIPGKGDITLTKTGRYTVFHQYEGIGSLPYLNKRDTLPTLQCTLVSKKTGRGIELAREDYPSRHEDLIYFKYIEMFHFTITQPDIYEFSGQYFIGDYRPKAVLAVRYDPEGLEMRIILVFFMSLFIGVIVNLLFLRKKQTVNGDVKILNDDNK